MQRTVTHEYRGHSGVRLRNPTLFDVACKTGDIQWDVFPFTLVLLSSEREHSLMHEFSRRLDNKRITWADALTPEAGLRATEYILPMLSSLE